LFRCGNAYSQFPCAPAASAVRIAPVAAPDVPAGAHGKELCGASAIAQMRVSETNTARIESVVKASAEVIQYAGQPILAHKYIMTVSMTNADGVRVGSRPYACLLSEDERRILQVVPAR
jgi:hypothetical protein